MHVELPEPHSFLNSAGLYGIAGPQFPGPLAARRQQTLNLADDLLAAGVPVIQLRDKWASTRELLELAHLLREKTLQAKVAFIVNDRPDIAILSGADGVHVGQDDLDIADVRRFEQALSRTRPLVVGVSTHNLKQVRDALDSGADYLGFGPVFPTQTKENPDPTVGLEVLSAAVKLAGNIPVVAIGGIEQKNAPQVQESGARFAAVIGDIVQSADSRTRAEQIHRLWG